MNKMPEFYMAFAPKIFFPDFLPQPPSPTPMAVTNRSTLDNALNAWKLPCATQYSQYMELNVAVHRKRNFYFRPKTESRYSGPKPSSSLTPACQGP